MWVRVRGESGWQAHSASGAGHYLMRKVTERTQEVTRQRELTVEGGEVRLGEELVTALAVADGKQRRGRKRTLGGSWPMADGDLLDAELTNALGEGKKLRAWFRPLVPVERVPRAQIDPTPDAWLYSPECIDFSLIRRTMERVSALVAEGRASESVSKSSWGRKHIFKDALPTAEELVASTGARMPRLRGVQEFKDRLVAALVTLAGCCRCVRSELSIAGVAFPAGDLEQQGAFLRDSCEERSVEFTDAVVAEGGFESWEKPEDERAEAYERFWSDLERAKEDDRSDSTKVSAEDLEVSRAEWNRPELVDYVRRGGTLKGFRAVTEQGRAQLDVHAWRAPRLLGHGSSDPAMLVPVRLPEHVELATRDPGLATRGPLRKLALCRYADEECATLIGRRTPTGAAGYSEDPVLRKKDARRLQKPVAHDVVRKKRTLRGYVLGSDALMHCCHARAAFCHCEGAAGLVGDGARGNTVYR